MSTPLSEEQILKALQGISIPPQPQIMVDLQMEQFDPDPDLNRIVQLISQDVGLAGSILKVVNSSAFALQNRISSINQACALLGINSVISIVNTLSIRGELSDDDIVELGRFWDSTADVATACRLIAKQIGYPRPDEAYTLGLFHNAGIALLMKRHSNYLEVMQKAYATVQQRLIDTENELLRTNHAVVGYFVAKSWKLPPMICEAIAEHHSTAAIFADDDYPDVEKKTLLAILKMAEHICGNCRVLANQAEDYEWQNLEEELLQYVGLSPYDFQALAEMCEELGCGNSNYLKI